MTGASGFIGRRIQLALLDAGTPVRAIVRPGSKRRSLLDARCDIREGSLDDAEFLAGAVNGIGALVYCAGSVRGRTLQDFLPANVDGLRHCLDALCGQGVDVPVVLISSLAASRPGLSHYAYSKHLGEEVLREREGASWTILRPSATYGPGDTEMAPLLKLAGRGWAFQLGPAEQRISLLHSDDLAAAVLACLGTWPNSAGRIFDIDDGTPRGYDWPTVVKAAGGKHFRAVKIPRSILLALARLNLWLSTRFGYAPMLTPGKVQELTQRDWLCDNTAFVQATGWQPRRDLAHGLAGEHF